jgi:site-specific DNA recombinase
MKKAETTTRRSGTVRCAIYTRKSSEEGLEKEFNSLQAQREAARPSSAASGMKAGCACPRGMMTAGSPAPRWIGPLCSSCSPMSPAGRVDTVVVYKIDRLTRSLAGPNLRIA